MPYTQQERRKILDGHIKRLSEDLAYMMDGDKGDLNYVISRIVTLFVAAKGLSYKNASDGMAAMNDAALEWYCRVMRPYEDMKKRENGDVYDEVIEQLVEMLEAEEVRNAIQ